MYERNFESSLYFKLVRKYFIVQIFLKLQEKLALQPMQCIFPDIFISKRRRNFLNTLQFEEPFIIVLIVCYERYQLR